MSRRWSPEKAREARIERGLTQADVAVALDVQRTTVVTWENGQDPQLRYAAALADLLGLSLDALFVHEGNVADSLDPRGKTHVARPAVVEGSPGDAHLEVSR